MTTLTPATRNDLIAVGLMALHARLQAAEETAGGAIIAVAARHQNLAIGHLLDLDRCPNATRSTGQSSCCIAKARPPQRKEVRHE